MVKGGKKGFYGIVAYYVNSLGYIKDLLLALLQLLGAHSSKRIALVI